jgi:sec-independent protein translocase protein TatB
MLGLGWTEMLVIGVIALIVIGPKDLPVVMNRVGKIIGQVRRMGSEFQREINRSTGLDEVRNLRSSITAPLKKTTDEIRKEFNAMTPSGPKPSGIIKPTDPSAESVVDEIKAQAGMTPRKTADQVAAEAGFKPTRPAPAASKAAVAPPAKKTAKSPVKAAAAPTRPVVTTDLTPLDAVPHPAEAQPVVKPARKPRTPKVTEQPPVPVLPTEPADSPATKTPRTRAPRKPATTKAGSK